MLNNIAIWNQVESEKWIYFLNSLYKIVTVEIVQNSKQEFKYYSDTPK